VAGGVDSRAFNVGTAIETTVLELARALQQAAGSASDIHHAPPRPGEQRRSAVRIDKAARVLGWRPAMSLQQGLRETFEWFVARRTEVNP
jgi:UDP-glucose 4-epimerase